MPNHAGCVTIFETPNMPMGIAGTRTNPNALIEDPPLPPDNPPPRTLQHPQKATPRNNTHATALPDIHTTLHLSLARVTADMSGTYSCVAANSEGEASQALSLNVLCE